jgi:spherulation-specific family 4 protein
VTQLASDGTVLVAPQLVVPAYFHPAVRPEEWALLTERAAHVRLIILNLASGPGTEPDAAFYPTLDRLHSAGVPVAGYVDTNYSQRPLDEVIDEVGRYIDWYSVSGVFFDRVPVAAGDLAHYADLTLRAREKGVDVVAFNHGAHPVEAYAEHADLLGTFEGPWRDYVDVAVPRWARSRPAGQFFHLVYSVPLESFGDAFLLAARRRAGCVYVTDHGGDNPWDRLPAGEFDPQAS